MASSVRKRFSHHKLPVKLNIVMYLSPGDKLPSFVAMLERDGDVKVISVNDQAGLPFEVMNALLLNEGPLVAGRPIVARSFVANSPSWCRTQWLFMPPLAAVRRDARFKTLCSEIGLERYWTLRAVGPDTSIPNV